MEDGQEPSWLASLRSEQEAESPQAEDPWGVPAQPEPIEDLPGRMSQPDVMEDLREQAIRAQGEIEPEKKSRLAELFQGLKPWQRLVLALLLFLNVAVCGCMALVMTGQVLLPF